MSYDLELELERTVTNALTMYAPIKRNILYIEAWSKTFPTVISSSVIFSCLSKSPMLLNDSTVRPFLVVIFVGI
jgi:hypothetical protein